MAACFMHMEQWLSEMSLHAATGLGFKVCSGLGTQLPIECSNAELSRLEC